MTTNKICKNCGHDEIKHEGKYGCFDDIIYNKKSCDCKKFKPSLYVPILPKNFPQPLF